MELYASYVYMTMAFHFHRDDVALNGFYKFFLNESEEERQHAIKLMTYQNMRGGRIVLQDISAPPQLSWTSGLHAMQDALELEKKVNQSLMDLVAVGEQASGNLNKPNPISRIGNFSYNFWGHKVEIIWGNSNTIN
uniref:Ferritin n=1 Tax=Schistosoma japonicum TaxID=6182 RepID=Q5D9N3_SCHJA|nr:SJCHGC02278 protein [Schistosoma japonicum]